MVCKEQGQVHCQRGVNIRCDYRCCRSVPPPPLSQMDGEECLEQSPCACQGRWGGGGGARLFAPRGGRVHVSGLTPASAPAGGVQTREREAGSPVISGKAGAHL